MQILESSVLGLRTARMVFRARNSAASVTLYPMVHVGEERFYKETYEEAFSHDIVLVEGVRSSVVWSLTRSYRWLDFGRLGLIAQPKTPPQNSVAARIVQADLTPDEFHREWRKVSLPLRAAFLTASPLYGLHGRYFSSRERLARNMCLEDRQSADESSRPFEPVHHSVIHMRDKRLVACMAAELDGANGSDMRMAIVYGARHMRAALRELSRRGFHCSQTTWRTIFSLGRLKTVR